MRTVEFKGLADKPGLLGKGLYGRVFHHGVDRVKKIASVDGTLEYLKWAMARGKRYSIHSPQMRGLPKVHSVEEVLLDNGTNGYEAVMDRYQKANLSLGGAEYNTHAYFDGLKRMRAICEWFEPICAQFHVDYHDLHYGNVMFDPRRMEYVITDPFSSCGLFTPSPTARFPTQERQEAKRF